MKRLNNYNTEILKTEIGKTNTKDFKYAVEYFLKKKKNFRKKKLFYMFQTIERFL